MDGRKVGSMSGAAARTGRFRKVIIYKKYII